MHEKQVRTWRTPEFFLVVIMLVALVVLVWAVLRVEIFRPPGDETAFRDVLDYRKSILSVIITAFAAWVGAAAAYFFGRENLREAASSILAMRGPSPGERLRLTPIRDIPPSPLDWVVTRGDELKAVMERLKDEAWRWFIPVVRDDGTLKTVLDEEAVWRFVDKESEAGTAYADIHKKKVSDVVEYIRTTPGLGRLKGIYVAVTLDSSAGHAYELMQKQDVRLAIVRDKRGKPTHYITTGDVRVALLQVG